MPCPEATGPRPRAERRRTQGPGGEGQGIKPVDHDKPGLGQVIAHFMDQPKPGQRLDPLKAFAPVAGLFTTPLMIVANNDFPARNPKELVAALTLRRLRVLAQLCQQLLNAGERSLGPPFHFEQAGVKQLHHHIGGIGLQGLVLDVKVGSGAFMASLPQAQKAALLYPSKVPMQYTNVLLRDWKAWAKLGIKAIHAPNGYHTTTALDTPMAIGGYRSAQTPDEPVVLHMVRNPNSPGSPRKEQNRIGRADMLATDYTTIEREIRSQLQRMLGSAGFEAARDIAKLRALTLTEGEGLQPERAVRLYRLPADGPDTLRLKVYHTRGALALFRPVGCGFPACAGLRAGCGAAKRAGINSGKANPCPSTSRPHGGWPSWPVSASRSLTCPSWQGSLTTS